MTNKNEVKQTSRVSPGREKFAFLHGFNQITVKDAKQVQKEIMKALSIKTRVAWYSRLYGDVEPKITEYNAIERIFTKYGVKQCWGA